MQSLTNCLILPLPSREVTKVTKQQAKPGLETDAGNRTVHVKQRVFAKIYLNKD